MDRKHCVTVQLPLHYSSLHYFWICTGCLCHAPFSCGIEQDLFCFGTAPHPQYGDSDPSFSSREPWPQTWSFWLSSQHLHTQLQTSPVLTGGQGLIKPTGCHLQKTEMKFRVSRTLLSTVAPLDPVHEDHKQYQRPGTTLTSNTSPGMCLTLCLVYRHKLGQIFWPLLPSASSWGQMLGLCKWIC